MLIPLGILAASGGVAGASYELIESTILTTNTSSVTFSSLATYASTYKHLQIRYTARATFTSASRGAVEMRFNGDTGANYDSHALYGDGSSVTSFYNAANQIFIFDVPYINTSGNEYAAGVVDILDAYSTTKNTTTRALAGFASIGGFNRLGLNSGLYRNTSAVSSVTLFAGAHNFYSGSRFSLYGVRG